MFGWLVFSLVVSVVEFAGAPVDAKLFLAFSVAEQVESHIHGFCSFGLNFTIYNRFSHRVVRLKWRGWLFMSHFF